MKLRPWMLTLATLPWLIACASDDPAPIVEPIPPAGQPELGAQGPTSGESTPSSNTAELKFVASPGADERACTCTRRPAGVPSRYCPWGTGASVTQQVGSAGGELVLGGTAPTVGVSAKAKISAGALAKAVQVTWSELSTPPPADFVDYSPIYKLEPLTLQLATAGELVLPGENIPGTLLNERWLYHATSPEGPFARVADSYSNAGFYQAPLTRGGYYFVGYPASEAICPDSLPRNPVNVSACPCTRRGQGSSDQRCAVGTGASDSKTIQPGPQGGTVQISGTPNTRGVPAKAEIAGGALTKTTTVVLTELQAEPPAGFVDYSPVYRVEPLDMALVAPSEIMLPGANTSETYPDALAIYYTGSVNEPFKRLPDSYTNAGFWQATLARGGYYFVGYPASLLPPGLCQ